MKRLLNIKQCFVLFTGKLFFFVFNYIALYFLSFLCRRLAKRDKGKFPLEDFLVFCRCFFVSIMPVMNKKIVQGARSLKVKTFLIYIFDVKDA
jgi:hypothetical protein